MIDSSEPTPGGGRRAMWIALLCLAAAGVLALVSAGRVWGRAELSGGPVGQPADNVVDVAGSDLLPAASALALVALAALLAVPATRRLGRRVIGAVVLLAGGLLTVMALVTALDLQRQVVRWVDLGDHLGSVATVTAVPLWPAATAAAGVVIAGAGLAVAVLGPRWPGMGARYERPTNKAQTPSEAASQPPSEGKPRPQRPADTWDALDRGEDPT